MGGGGRNRGKLVDPVDEYRSTICWSTQHDCHSAISVSMASLRQLPQESRQACGSIIMDRVHDYSYSWIGPQFHNLKFVNNFPTLFLSINIKDIFLKKIHKFGYKVNPDTLRSHFIIIWVHNIFFFLKCMFVYINISWNSLFK